MTKKCEGCGKEVGPRFKYCKECSHERKKARENRTPPMAHCERCGKEFQPYRTGVKRCNECPRPAQNRTFEKVEPDAQMEKLFRYYKERDSVEVSSRPDGTRLLAISDLQLPFVDEPLLEALYSFVQDWKPNDIILNGDVIDAYEISDFDQRPERLFNLDTEMEMAKSVLGNLKRYAAKDAKFFWADGNHEQRLQRIIWRRAQNFSFLVKDIPEALELDKYCEAYVPYGKHIDYLGFVFTHGNFVSQYSAYTAKRHMDRYRSSGANGHTHRLGSYSSTDMHGRSHTWMEMGCLCRTDLEYIKGIANWQSGWLTGVVYDNALFPTLVNVINTNEGRSFVAGGKHYRV